jgi:hypothetical protein
MLDITAYVEEYERMKTQTETIETLTEALRSILVQDAGDLSDAAFRRYVCDQIATKTLAKVEGAAA